MIFIIIIIYYLIKFKPFYQLSLALSFPLVIDFVAFQSRPISFSLIQSSLIFTFFSPEFALKLTVPIKLIITFINAQHFLLLVSVYFEVHDLLSNFYLYVLTLLVFFKSIEYFMIDGYYGRYHCDLLQNAFIFMQAHFLSLLLEY